MDSSAIRAVFLSYAREDSESARRIADALRAFGIEVWFDQNELRGGDAWDQKIRGRIKDCALFMPIISASTQQRGEGYFRLEWKLAVDRSHLMAEGVPFLAPVVVDDTSEAVAIVPAEFLRVQWTRLAKGLPSPEFIEQTARLLAQPRLPVARGTSHPTMRAPAEGSQKRGAMPILVGLGVVAVAIAAYQVLLPAGMELPARPAVTVAAKPAAVTNEKSIAVLPFENMSDDKESGYFADGVQEDVITNLSFISNLKVVPRATAMRYRDTKKTVRQIGEELGVAYVLTATVRRSGGQVRITGTLINAQTEEHVWVKPYLKDLNDVFAIQAALATEIAGALRAAISPETQKLIRRVLTENAAAYDRFIRARELTNAGGGPEVETLLQEAVTLDPKFAVAWAWLAKIHGLAYLSNRDRTPERLAKAKVAIDMAVRLAPDDPEVVFNLGYYYYHEGRDYARALEQLERGARLQPGAALWNFGRGGIERRMGKFADALTNFRQAAQIDPGNIDYLRQEFLVALAGRRFDEALVVQRRLAALGDRMADEHAEARLHFLRSGSTREMEAYFATLAPEEQRIRRRLWAALTGDYAEAIRDLPPATPQRTVGSFELALCLAANGDLAAAQARIAPWTVPLRERLKTEPENATVWRQLACLEAVLGNKEEALRCAEKSVELLPERIDTWQGPALRVDLAFVYAWTGDKTRAIAEYARRLRTPGANTSFLPWPNVHVMRRHPAFAPLHGDPRFEALLADPKNNAPLF